MKHAMDDTPMFGDPCGPWVRTFAWLPRFTFDGGIVWLRLVWKRHIYKHQYLDGGADYWWHYRRFPPVDGYGTPSRQG